MPTITASYFLRLAVNLNQSMPNCDLDCKTANNYLWCSKNYYLYYL